MSERLKGYEETDEKLNPDNDIVPMENNWIIIDSQLPPIPNVNINKHFKLCCGGRCRFSLSFPILALGIFVIPFLVPLSVTLSLNLFYSAQLLFYIILATINHCKIISRLKKNNVVINEEIIFIMMTFIYKEPLELIMATLKNLNDSEYKKPYILLICIEGRTPEVKEKIEEMRKQFQGKFNKVVVTVHPYGVDGEIPGKCSNANYGIRSLFSHLQNTEKDFKPENYFVTNFDIDTKFHSNFLNILTQTILEDKDKYTTVFQPFLYYNWNLDKLSFFTRVTGLMRNVMMMGALTPLDINIMSVYTASINLYIKGDFIHPAYQMEDIICYVRWLIKSGENLKIKPVHVPTVSGPTSGYNFCNEFAEWARQQRRWSLGAAEVFHYFCVKFKSLKFWTGLIWGLKFLNYYVGVMCAQSLLILSTTSAGFIYTDKNQINNLYFLIPLGIFYFSMLWVFIMNKCALSTLKNVIPEENFGILRNIFHYLSSLFVMLGISICSLYGYIESLTAGKKACKHGASAKNALGKIDVVEQ